MPRAKKKPLPQILEHKIARPISFYDDEELWGFFYESPDRFNSLKQEFTKREKALFKYLNIPYVEIKQLEVHELIRKLAIYGGIPGFNYTNQISRNGWKGNKGLILFLRIELEHIKTGDSYEQCAGNIANMDFEGYSENQDVLYVRYKEAKKNSPAKSFKKFIDSQESPEHKEKVINHLLRKYGGKQYNESDSDEEEEN